MRFVALLVLCPTVAAADPEVVTAPTGHLVASHALYARSDVDTQWGWSERLRLGLGEVAEFGLMSSDAWSTATFCMGMRGAALGFEKSFERDVGGLPGRIAHLDVVYSRSLGETAALHGGVTLWDAQRGDELLHDRGLRHQLRPVAGVQARVFDDAVAVADLSWRADFCVDEAAVAGATPSLRAPCIRLVPVASVGVRYHVSTGVHLQSGIRVVDRAAHVFGQLTLSTGRLW